MLTETAIRAAKPREKAYKMSDERGLFLLITPTGNRWWRFKYIRFGKERGMSMGVYPDVSLAMARKRRDEARTLLADGIDPSSKRKAEKLANASTFRAIAEEWLDLQKGKLHVRTYDKARYQLEAFVYPRLGNTPISKITAPDLLAALRKVEVSGRHETAHRTKQRCGQIFRFAIATGRAEHDPSVHLRGALAPIVSRNRAALTDPAQVGQLLRAIEGYVGNTATAYALKLAPLTMVRPGELRLARWSEIDLDNAEWRIPAERMKMRELHLVPLSRQAVELFQELKAVTGDGEYVFTSFRTSQRPMSNNTVNAALRRLGYTKDEMTGHGFRALASTLLNEQGWHPDLIELQLAHAERNKVRAAYNRAQRLPERRKMMQAWADYLDGLRGSTGGNVFNIRAA
jgi:integrase